MDTVKTPEIRELIIDAILKDADDITALLAPSVVELSHRFNWNEIEIGAVIQLMATTHTRTAVATVETAINILTEIAKRQKKDG